MRKPATGSLTEKSDATSGNRPAITNSVRPMPKPPTASAMRPTRMCLPFWSDVFARRHREGDGSVEASVRAPVRVRDGWGRRDSVELLPGGCLLRAVSHDADAHPANQ